MITAKEAAKKSFDIKAKGLTEEQQLKEISDLIEQEVISGGTGIYYHAPELLGGVLNKLNELGYSYSSGYGVDCKSYWIHW